jgi:tRNA(Ile)-lysidine synthase
MAVLQLLVQAGGRVRAVTVDHRLRAEAADEAAFVGQVCEGLGVRHDTLVWDHGVVAGNLMDQARRARYGLLAAWARGAGIGCVVLGHTADDQAETFLMGLARGTGLDGLVGMRARFVQDGVTFARPFLDVTREALRAYLTARCVAWADDPTNADEHYTRVKARQALVALQPLGITVRRLSEAMGNLRMAQGAVTASVAAAFAGIGQEPAGVVVLERAGFLNLPAEVRHRLLVMALRWVSAAEHPPRADGIGRVGVAIGMSKDATLLGCSVRVAGDVVRIARELKAVAGKDCATTDRWDSRWQLSGPHAPDLTIRALGDGIRQVPNWRTTGLPRDTLVVSPAIWRGDTLIAAPLAGFSAGWTAKIPQSFHAFILSH